VQKYNFWTISNKLVTFCLKAFFFCPHIVFTAFLKKLCLPKNHYIELSSLHMAVKIIDHGTKEYKQMVELRYQMLRKPLGLSFTQEELAQEKGNIHIGCFDDDKLEGCCMLVPKDSSTIQLRQMAVISGLQGKGIGRVLMQFAENISRDLNYKKLMMHARKTAAGFYEKLGYSKTGEEFFEVTIPHLVMEKCL